MKTKIFYTNFSFSQIFTSLNLYIFYLYFLNKNHIIKILNIIFIKTFFPNIKKFVFLKLFKDLLNVYYLNLLKIFYIN